VKLSQKRKTALMVSRADVESLYQGAVNHWGEEKVKKDLTRLWDLRCIWGMKNVMPFGSTEFKNLSEMLYVARELCGYGNG
jgi:aminoglycoside/choline kinase family phosphotransferase